MKTLSNYISEKLVINKDYKNFEVKKAYEIIDKYLNNRQYSNLGLHDHMLFGFMTNINWKKEDDDISLTKIWYSIKNISEENREYILEDLVLNGEIICVASYGVPNSYAAVTIVFKTSFKNYKYFKIEFYGPQDKMGVVGQLFNDFDEHVYNIKNSCIVKNHQFIVDLANFIIEHDLEDPQKITKNDLDKILKDIK